MDIQTLADLKSRSQETDAELAMARKSEADLRLSRQSLEDELVEVKKKLRDTEVSRGPSVLLPLTCATGLA